MTDARRRVQEFVRQRSSISNILALSFGVVLVLLSGPIGDWNDFLSYLVVGGGPTSKYGYPGGLERAPGWLVLVLGWVCLAFGLRSTAPTPSAPDPTAQRRSSWQRFVVAALATLGTYVALASHCASPLQLTIDVINAPPSKELHVGAVVDSLPRNSSRYGSAFDYLFGFTSPYHKVSISRETHTQYRFPAGRVSLENWQPFLYQVFVGVKATHQRESAFVSIRFDASFIEPETIVVNRASLQPCSGHPSPTEGNCLRQQAPLSSRQRNVHVVFDLAQIELTPYAGAPFYEW